MIKLNVTKMAMFLPVKNQKSSLLNSAARQKVERFHEKSKVVAIYVPQGRVYLKVHAFAL